MAAMAEKTLVTCLDLAPASDPLPGAARGGDAVCISL